MGQYDARWPYIHMTPEEAAQAAEALDAKALLPAHVGKFSIARHAWDEPFERIAAASEGKRYRLPTPMIGEPIHLADARQRFGRWWRSDVQIAATSAPRKQAEQESMYANTDCNRCPGAVAGSPVVRLGRG